MNTAKQIIKKYSGFVQDDFNGKYPFGIPKLPAGYLKSFGSKHPDKFFYVIWRDRLGSGFFSNFTQVIAHVMLAESMGMIPVVDYCNFKTLYNVKEPVNGSLNAWEYYFHQPAGFSIEEVYLSKNVFISNGDYPRGFFPATHREYRDFCHSHFSFQPNVKGRIAQYEPLLATNRTLGIHFRGKEMNFMPLHPLAPTPQQIFKATDNLLEEFGFEQIFLVTEEQAYLELYLKRYGKRVIYTDAFRSRNVNSYNLNSRPQHRYMLGLEILADAELLAQCGGLLGSNTGPFNHALRISDSLEIAERIDNGFNSNNYLIAKCLYPFKKFMGSLPGTGARIYNPPQQSVC
jgi:hypothetical protein